jgi:hypothetical protein
MAQDCTGAKPIGIDDEAQVTVTSPSGQQQVVTISENDAWGEPIGEQWVLSNVIDFEPGLNQIKVDIVNVYAPSGSNAASSAIYIVVLPAQTPTTSSDEKTVLIWCCPGVRNAMLYGETPLPVGQDNSVTVKHDQAIWAEYDYTDQFGREQHTRVELDNYYDYFVLRENGGWSQSKYPDGYEADKSTCPAASP